MSRVSYNDSILNDGRWRRNTKTTIASKRGQVALRELREALLAMPQRALVEGTFYERNEEDGTEQACVLGAYARYKGKVEAFPFWVNEMGAAMQAAIAAEQLGLAFTLAWNLVDFNDEHTKSLKPEARWQWFMDWLDKNLITRSEPAPR